MANRLFFPLAAAFITLLGALHTAPLCAAAAKSGTEETAPTQADTLHREENNASSQKKSGRRVKKKGGKRPSAFVLLGQRLLDDRPATIDFADRTAGFVDPAISGDPWFDKDMRWIFARVESRPLRSIRDHEPSWGDSRQRRIVLQRLDVNRGNSASLFVDVFSPVAPGPLTERFDEGFLSGDVALPTGLEQEHEVNVLIEGASSVSSTTASSDAPFAYRYRMDKKSSVNAGFSWIHDITDTTGMEQAFKKAGYGNSADSVSALNLSLGASYRAFTLTGGYIRAIDTSVGPADLATSEDTEPIAWNSELAYSTELLRKETTLAVGYQKSSESLQLYLPEERYRTKASMVLFDSTVFTLEYYLDKEYSTRNGITEDEGYGITTKIGFQF